MVGAATFAVAVGSGGALAGTIALGGCRLANLVVDSLKLDLPDETTLASLAPAREATAQDGPAVLLGLTHKAAADATDVPDASVEIIHDPRNLRPHNPPALGTSPDDKVRVSRRCEARNEGRRHGK